MNFQDLHELLRLELLRRIERGALTGTRLAQQAGFQQAHVSNFLNRKRSLSLEGLDRVMESQQLGIDQLLPVELLAGSASSGVNEHEMEAIPVVSSSAAMDDTRVTAANSIETIHVSASRLQGNRARPSARYGTVQRFVAIRADAQQAMAMEPILTAGTIAVLDRHYNSLAPYRAHQPTLFAVRYGTSLLLRFVELEDGRLILRPYARAFPVQLLTVSPELAPSDYIVGRVCMLLSEL